MQNYSSMQIYFNGKVIKASFHKDDIYIYTIGINMVVEMAEIETIVTYSGLIFLIKVPFSLFNNNTEGQCGKKNILIPSKLFLFREIFANSYAFKVVETILYISALRKMLVSLVNF